MSDQAPLELKSTEPVRLHWWQWAAVVLAGIAFVAVAVGGPWLWVREISAQNAQTASIKKDLQNTETVVNYIHQIQTSQSSTASRESSLWVLTELQRTCAATPGCVNAPLPPALAKLLQQKQG